MKKTVDTTTCTRKQKHGNSTDRHALQIPSKGPNTGGPRAPQTMPRSVPVTALGPDIVRLPTDAPSAPAPARIMRPSFLLSVAHRVTRSLALPTRTSDT